MVYGDRDSRGPRGGSGGYGGSSSSSRRDDRDRDGGGYGGGSNMSAFGLPSSFGGSRYGKDLGAGQKLKKPRWDKYDLEPIQKHFYKVRVHCKFLVVPLYSLECLSLPVCLALTAYSGSTFPHHVDSSSCALGNPVEGMIY